MTEFIFILVRPEIPGNVGFSARGIKNFGFHELVLVNPCEFTSETYKFAMHAENIVKNSHTYASLQETLREEKLNYLVGTTARIGGSKNPKRNALPSNRLRRYPIPSEGKIGVVFGPEKTGLENEEIKLCDLVVTIPSSEEYPSLNLSHAVTVLAYEISLREEKGRSLPYESSYKKERKILIKYWTEMIEELFKEMSEGKIRIYKGIIENLLSRSFLTRRETHSLIGMSKKIMREAK